VKHLKRVPVGHVFYKLERAARFKDDRLAECDYGRRIIRIARHQRAPMQWANSFWHEFFHAAFYELGYEPDADSEAKVEGFAHIMLSLLTHAEGRQLLANMIRHMPEQ
jgi:hypothetical protein